MSTPQRSFRVGLIVPPSNTTNEREFARFTDEALSFHTVRMPLHLDSSVPDYRTKVFADLDAACIRLTPCRPDLAVYACTAGSILMSSSDLCARIAQLVGCPAITTSGSIVGALRALNAKSLAVATPYTDDLNQSEKTHFEAEGFSVAAIGGLSIPIVAPDLYRISATSQSVLIDHVRATLSRSGSVDAIHISCTDLPTFDAIEEIEQETRLPVVTSNQAMLWQICRSLGVAPPAAAPGQLMRLPR